MSNSTKTGLEFIDFMLHFDIVFIIHLALFVMLISAFFVMVFIYRFNEMLQRKREEKRAKLFNLALNKNSSKNEEP